MDTEDSLASLTIFDVDQNDAGIYRCELHNQHGRVESTGLLTVNGIWHRLLCSFLYRELYIKSPKIQNFTLMTSLKCSQRFESSMFCQHSSTTWVWGLPDQSIPGRVGCQINFHDPVPSLTGSTHQLPTTQCFIHLML